MSSTCAHLLTQAASCLSIMNVVCDDWYATPLEVGIMFYAMRGDLLYFYSHSAVMWYYCSGYNYSSGEKNNCWLLRL